MTGLKRALDESSHAGDDGSPQAQAQTQALDQPAATKTSPAASSSASSFRNVSACNSLSRCRLRKNRCDQNLPSCASCDKASVKCVGYDPITKRSIPRSYVYYLETRVAHLESLLNANTIPYAAAEEFNPSLQPQSRSTPTPKAQVSPTGPPQQPNGAANKPSSDLTKGESDQHARKNLDNLVSNIGMVSVQGTSDARFLGSTSGISFARVVFAAVKSTVSGSSSERGSVRGGKSITSNVAEGGASMRDSFFGLQTKPTFRQAPFPDRELGARLVKLYFEHANPQIPILHRGEFMDMFERVYTAGPTRRTSRESYMLNIVFAIGAGTIMDSSDSGPSPTSEDGRSPTKTPISPPSNKKRRLAGQQHQPEEYHTSAILHLENFLGSSPAADRPDGFGGGLEELQAVLLLAGFALLRPVAPGLWYIVGVAVRLGVDLGLHYEDGVGIDGGSGPDENEEKVEPLKGDTSAAPSSGKIDAKERGRRQWVRDLRRRLWWCVYSLDRLVSTCVGRPFGITDQVVTTEFPSLLDDRFITKEGFLDPPDHLRRPSYKVVAQHYFRLRLLQSEILQVLQHRQAQQARESGANQGNEYMHTNLPSPFLAGYTSFRTWRVDIDRRLLEWKESAPTGDDAGVQFSPLFLELNYWQAIIMLYRQSLVVPTGLAGELGNTDSGVRSPSVISTEEQEDEELVFHKVAVAGQSVLKLYRQLHRLHLVNYTFLATHHLFMAGISFLYAVWHSPAVRSHLSLDDVDFTVLAATSVLGDLMEKCPPAEACRDAFDRMSKATIQMCIATTGFGPKAHQQVPQQMHGSMRPSQSPNTIYTPTTSSDADARSDTEITAANAYPQAGYFQHSRRPVPRFDMNLKDLFSEDETDRRSFSRISNQIHSMRPPPLPPPIKQEPPPPQQQTQSFSSDLNMSPQIPRFPQQQQQPSYSFQPLSSPSYPLSTTISTTLSQQQQQSLSSPYQTLPYNTFAQNMSSTYPDLGAFSDLEFPDSFPEPGGAGAGMGGDEVGSAGGGLQDLGFGMGFGIGDGTHDWSEGNGFDLFDGFFFGPGGSGGGV